jgi:hypothetical protein
MNVAFERPCKQVAQRANSNNLPDTAYRSWGQRVQDFDGYTPYWDRS